MKEEFQQFASAYLPCEDLWIITTFYNPGGFETKRKNYENFAQPIRNAGLKLLTVECAFGDAPFELAPGTDVIQVRGRDIMWMKERLINLAISRLPYQAAKIMWIDCDLLFCNPGWAVQTSRLLDEYSLVQPCATLHRLGRSEIAYRGLGYRRDSFAAQLQRRPESGLLRGAAHGFPGGAWAARRSHLETHPLYDAAILGGGDELFAHALGGGWASPCVRGITNSSRTEWPWLIERLLNRLSRLPLPRRMALWYVQRAVSSITSPISDETFYAHYLRWAQAFYCDVRGQVGFVHGMMLHLWHGDPVNRQYGSRNAILRRHSFNPAIDLRLNADDLWEWASDKPDLHREVRDYFRARREDGDV